MSKITLINFILFFIICISGLSQPLQYNGPIYPKIRPDKLIKSHFDSSGRIQGMVIWRDTSNRITRIETMKDDIPNGYFGLYYDSMRNAIRKEGFYKNGKLDSLFYIYSTSGELFCAGTYKEGLLSGCYFEYHPDGTVALERHYRKDSVIGYEIEYYPSGHIETIRNKQKNIDKKFYDNDQLEEIQEETIEKDRIICFSDTLKQIPPKFIKPIIIKNRAIYNQTALIVELLGTHEDVEVEEDTVDDGTEYVGLIFPIPEVFMDDSIVTIRIFPGLIYKIKKEGLYYCEGCLDYDTRNKLKTYWTFGRNGKMYKNKKGEDVINYEIEEDIKLKLKSTHHQVVVHNKRLQCFDTGNNPITVTYQGKKLEIRDLKNLLVFEYDSDHDNKPELYIVSSKACEGTYKILRVRERRI